MNFFKKALVATAVVASFGATAADLTDAVTAHSIQGLEVNGASDSSVRVIVREQLEAGDKITLTFGEGVATTGLTVDADGTATTGELNVVYGSGTYTLKEHADTDLANNILVLEVETGDPVTKDSSFEVQVPKAAYDITKTALSTVTYSAESGLTGDPKDTTGDNVGVLITTATQYGATVKSRLDGIVERTNKLTFTENGEDAGEVISVNKDTLIVDITDDQTLLSAISFSTVTGTFDVEIDGNFTDFANTDIITASQGDDTCAAETVTATKMTVTCAAGVDAAVDGFTVEMTKQAAASSVLPATSFDTDLEVDFGGADNLSLLSSEDSGAWKIDATIINVPYFPVGYTGVQSTVILANEGTVATDVIVTAIDQNGTEYGPVNLNIATAFSSDLPAKTVSKVSDVLLMDLLGAPASTKLSVTFNIDASKDTVNAYAYTQKDGTGRSEVSTSQQRGN